MYIPVLFRVVELTRVFWKNLPNEDDLSRWCVTDPLSPCCGSVEDCAVSSSSTDTEPLSDGRFSMAGDGDGDASSKPSRSGSCGTRSRTGDDAAAISSGIMVVRRPFVFWS